MLYQIIIAAGLFLFLINLVLNLRGLKKPLLDAKIPRPAPFISVLVPARDEEANIGACLESLRRQDYPDFEVLVLDDNSVDDTAGIVNRMAAVDNRIKLISGAPLPNDWAGKPHACYQLAQRAGGDWLLFVDADTVHAPHMLRSVLDAAIKLKCSLLSGFPRQLAESFPQKIAVPVIYFIIMGWAPLWLIHRLKSTRPSVAIGQFLLFRRDEYWRIGGHKVVQSRILEDIWLGIEMSRRGGRHVAIDLSSVVSCNMYPAVGSMWSGLVRCVYSVSALSPVMLLVLVPLAWLFYIGPFYWLWNGFFMYDGAPLLWRGLVVFQVMLLFFMRWLVDNRFKEPPVSAWLHPLGMGYIFVVVVYSFLRWMVGAGVSWKERVYGEEESIVK
jgi:chlorobactene glucosyltransferase